jgi:hypothetical protein
MKRRIGFTLPYRLPSIAQARDLLQERSHRVGLWSCVGMHFGIVVVEGQQRVLRGRLLGNTPALVSRLPLQPRFTNRIEQIHEAVQSAGTDSIRA